ncbi:hypothetical protein DAEQUDRAFT_727995 [Daedalea quercina L-15889]|uniref:Uncharacterized protein n=1 Tax=Daedalea quercina L-15889 TaxID=1314783 RepID=A0A165PN44_9APHY|nr:hypothetical protein DAEQUDRAFT_727995 [Daedalea quercina L-15889]
MQIDFGLDNKNVCTGIQEAAQPIRARWFRTGISCARQGQLHIERDQYGPLADRTLTICRNCLTDATPAEDMATHGGRRSVTRIRHTHPAMQGSQALRGARCQGGRSILLGATSRGPNRDGELVLRGSFPLSTRGWFYSLIVYIFLLVTECENVFCHADDG